MAKFLYQAKNASGQVQMGQMEALDEGELRVKLKAQNLTPLKVLNAPGSSRRPDGSVVAVSVQVPSQDLQVFTRQFATLINAGIPVVDALKMLSEGKRTPMLKDAATKVKTSIEGGKRLGDAMAALPHVFDRFYVNMVRAGEEAGILDGILMRMSIYLEKSEKLKRQVKGALVYPAIILLVAAAVISVILIFVIPYFKDMYTSAGKELPAMTKFVVGLSETMIHKWYLILLIMIGVPWFLSTWYRTPDGKDTFDRILIRLPLFGDLIQKSSVAKMTRTLSTLLSSGVSVIEALEIAAKTAGNRVIEDALIRSKESVTAGRPLAAPLSKEKMIPDMVVQMINIGEQSGTLDQMLGKIADFYEDDVENAVKALTSLIEPLLLVFLAGIIAFLLASMYLPILDMANISGGR